MAIYLRKPGISFGHFLCENLLKENKKERFYRSIIFLTAAQWFINTFKTTLCCSFLCEVANKKI
jgi:hypothetical protein